MKFQPKTEKELNEAKLWPKGEYDFEVVEATPAVSGAKSKRPNTEYIKLNCKVYNKDGQFRFVRGMLHPAMDFALAHFCVMAGLQKQYEDGSLQASDCVGVAGKCKLKIEEGQGDYPAKNVIADYVVPKAKDEAAPAAEDKSKDDDSVPF